MTLIHNSSAGEDQLLIADTEMKFKLFDKNTFEILATFLGPIYDSDVQQFVSIYGATIHNDFDGLKVPLSFSLFKLFPFVKRFFFSLSRRMETLRSVARLMQSVLFSQPTKIFASTRCRSMEILFGAWVSSDIAVA